MKYMKPEVGQWYMTRDTNRVFEVVSLDETEAVELQDYEGALDEFDGDQWCALDLEAIGHPRRINVTAKVEGRALTRAAL